MVWIIEIYLLASEIINKQNCETYHQPSHITACVPFGAKLVCTIIERGLTKCGILIKLFYIAPCLGHVLATVRKCPLKTLLYSVFHIPFQKSMPCISFYPLSKPQGMLDPRWGVQGLHSKYYPINPYPNKSISKQIHILSLT